VEASAAETAESPFTNELAKLGLHGVVVGGILLYHIPPMGL
jgi:hypothetical protein